MRLLTSFLSDACEKVSATVNPDKVQATEVPSGKDIVDALDGSNKEVVLQPNANKQVTINFKFQSPVPVTLLFAFLTVKGATEVRFSFDNALTGAARTPNVSRYLYIINIQVRCKDISP